MRFRKLDIWEIATQYDSVQRKHKGSGIYSDYLKTFKPEIVEIISQLISENDLAGFKVNKLSHRKKIRDSVIRPFSAFFFKRPHFYNSIPLPSFNLIFVLEYESHYRQYVPLSQELNRRGFQYLVVFINEELFNRHKHDVEHKYVLIENPSKAELLKNTLKYLKISLHLLLDHELLKLAPRNKKALLTELHYLNSKCLLNKFLLENTFNKVITDKNKIAVFFKSEGYKIRSLLDVCNLHGIETIAVQHGLIKKNIKYSDLPVKTYFVWSELFAKELEHSGANCKTLPVGSPYYDDHFTKYAQGKHDEISGKRRVLFLPNSGKSQTPESEIVFALGMCLKFVSENSMYSLTIKPHPGGDVSLMRDILKEYTGNSIVQLSTQDQIEFQNYYFIITMNSTIGIEAAIYRRPLLILLTSQKMLMVQDYISNGIAEFADSYENMITSIERIEGNYPYYQNNCDRFVNLYLANPGNSSSIISSIIDNKLNINA